MTSVVWKSTGEESGYCASATVPVALLGKYWRSEL